MYLEKWSCKSSTLRITGFSLRGTVSSMDVKSTCNSSPRPLQVRGFIGATGGAASYFLQQLHLLMRFLRLRSHTWPPEALLHQSYGVTLTLMGHLPVATIKHGAPMSLRNYKLEHHLISLSLLGLPVQEAVLDE